jgi:hypothetical protein
MALPVAAQCGHGLGVAASRVLQQRGHSDLTLPSKACRLGVAGRVRAVRGRAPEVIGLLVVALVAAGCGSSRPPKREATARFIPPHRVQIQLVLTARGDPSLGDNADGLGALPKMGWLACCPGADSWPQIKRGVTQPGPISQELVPGRTRSGWSFEAVARTNGRTYRARSSIWLGRVRPVTAARISGTAVVGAQVRPIAGSWSGGWSGATVRQPRGGSLFASRPDQDQLSIEACRTRSGKTPSDQITVLPRRLMHRPRSTSSHSHY